MGRGLAALLAVSMAGALALGPGTGAALAQQDEHLDKAAQVLGRFLNEPGNTGMREALKRARAVLVVPSYVRAGFVIGGTGGGGVMLMRKAEGGGWNGPAFYDTAAGTLGPQLGVYKTELVMLFMSERAVERALAGEMQFGADASVAAGPVGAGEKGPWADIYTYVKPVGAYAGVSISSGAVEPDRSENEEFYGRGATARAILVDGRFNTDKGKVLRQLLSPY